MLAVVGLKWKGTLCTGTAALVQHTTFALSDLRSAHATGSAGTHVLLRSTGREARIELSDTRSKPFLALIHSESAVPVTRRDFDLAPLRVS